MRQLCSASAPEWSADNLRTERDRNRADTCKMLEVNGCSQGPSGQAMRICEPSNAHASSLVSPVIARATLPRQAITRNREGKMGAVSSRHMPAPQQQTAHDRLAAFGGRSCGGAARGVPNRKAPLLLVLFKESGNSCNCSAGKHMSHLHCSSSLQRASIAWHTHPGCYPAATTKLWALAAVC